jgi:hypothetical protein
MTCIHISMLAGFSYFCPTHSILSFLFRLDDIFLYCNVLRSIHVYTFIYMLICSSVHLACPIFLHRCTAPSSQYEWLISAYKLNWHSWVYIVLPRVDYKKPRSYVIPSMIKSVHTTTGCGEQGFPSAQPYLSRLFCTVNTQYPLRA